MMGTGNFLKAAIRRAANALGYVIVAFDGRSSRWRLLHLLRQHQINLILDVGANSGAFGWDMRELGYSGRIVSFEPLPDAFAQLQKAAAGDPAWQTINVGLGDRDEERVLHVAANSQSSSLLPMLEAHVQAAPESVYTNDIAVTIHRLDAVADGYRKSGEALFLKIDTQGFELQVLNGARGLLTSVPLLQLECSLVPLYDGAMLVEDMIAFVRGLGYDPVDLAPTFYHRDSKHLMQIDALFLRRDAMR